MPKKNPQAASELKHILSSVIKSLKASGDISQEDLLSFFEEDTLPIDIFTPKLGILESAVKYLHEQRQAGFSEIARKLNRDPRTIWASFAAAKAKHPSRFKITNEVGIPVKALANRNLSPLESVSLELSHLPYHQIAKLLHRDQRNIWNTVNKARKHEKRA